MGEEGCAGATICGTVCDAVRSILGLGVDCPTLLDLFDAAELAAVTPAEFFSLYSYAAPLTA